MVYGTDRNHRKGGTDGLTIKQMEERSGMSRANIRFYEAEGLLCPARQENGYRDY